MRIFLVLVARVGWHMCLQCRSSMNQAISVHRLGRKRPLYQEVCILTMKKYSFLKNYVISTQVIVIIVVFCGARSIGFLNTLNLEASIPNTFSTATREDESFLLNIRFAVCSLCLPGYGFIT